MTAPEARAQPGPWRRDEYGHLVDANGKRLTFRDVTVHGGNYQPSIDEAVANTDLAMAAPSMAAERDRLLAALKQAALELEEAGKILCGNNLAATGSLFTEAAETARSAAARGEGS